VRITELNATPVAVPYRKPERWAYGVRRGLVSVLLELRTDEGLTGLGEAPAYPSAEIVQAVLRTLEPMVVGEDPLRIERLLNRINIIGTWHHVKATSPAIAAVEMACWDLLGKVSGQPVVALMGGYVRERAESIFYLGLEDAESMNRSAAEAVSRGYRTLYFKVGADQVDVDVERVAAVRDGAGAGARIRVTRTSPGRAAPRSAPCPGWRRTGWSSSNSRCRVATWPRWRTCAAAWTSRCWPTRPPGPDTTSSR
jgi:L-alanine-DL-glutamate epimerase-like enolase superfamily enzyme